MARIALATEDELSEQVGVCLAKEAGFEVGQVFRKGGAGYLKSKVAMFCEFAQHEPVLLLTDLDRRNCASALILDWLGKRKRPVDLLLRVAVREIESWVLADQHTVCALLNCPKSKVPLAPDQLSDPKLTLLSLAKHAPRKIREELVASEGVMASQGLGYNALLCSAVRSSWSATRAAQRSPSLHRARARLAQLAARIAST